VVDLQASPSGALLAVRSERGVQVLHVDTGAVMAVNTWTTPKGPAEVHASLELSVWDVVGEPREVTPPNHVEIGGHVLKDSPGRPRNIL